MQLAATDALDLANETQTTLDMYGIGKPLTDDYGRRCLLTRRLIEKGVRFVQVYNGGSGKSWDAHGDLRGNHTTMAGGYDQSAAALIQDLDARGLLQDTLVMGVTEFGRTPVA